MTAVRRRINGTTLAAFAGIASAAALGYLAGRAGGPRDHAEIAKAECEPCPQAGEGASFPRSAVAPEGTGAAPLAGAVAVPQQGPAARKAAAIATASDEVRSALEARRSMYYEKCWQWPPPDGAEAGKVGARLNGPDGSRPASSQNTYVFDISFDERGREIARGISQGPTSRRDIAECLRSIEDALVISPPGQIVSVSANVTIP